MFGWSVGPGSGCGDPPAIPGVGGEAEDSIWFAGRFDEGGDKVRVGEGGTLQLMATRPVPNQEP
jgi:hypothetical protein